MAAEQPRRIRKSGVMQLKPGKEEAYRASHNEGFWVREGASLPNPSARWHGRLPALPHPTPAPPHPYRSPR
jgi:hypothetical protein